MVKKCINHNNVLKIISILFYFHKWKRKNDSVRTRCLSSIAKHHRTSSCFYITQLDTLKLMLHISLRNTHNFLRHSDSYTGIVIQKTQFGIPKLFTSVGMWYNNVKTASHRSPHPRTVASHLQYTTCFAKKYIESLSGRNLFNGDNRISLTLPNAIHTSTNVHTKRNEFAICSKRLRLITISL